MVGRGIHIIGALLMLPMLSKPIVVRAQQVTTTLTQQTANNTSASSSFKGLPNGDSAPGNVSKVSIKKLLPRNFQGKVLAHWMPWWKCSTTPCDGVHDKRDILRVHYSTEDPAQLDKTIQDMISRGYDGLVVAESNSGGADTDGTIAMAQEMPKYPGFSFAISENHLNKVHSASDQMAMLMNDMAFAESHYFGMQNYLKLGGQPVVYVFDNGLIDWSTAAAQAPGHPIFILNGPSHASKTLGGFYWFGGLTDNESVPSATALGKMSSFYSQVASHGGNLYSGAVFKGFNDLDAPWGKRRIVEQACGLTFIRGLESVRANIALLQVATWNDYEEGTEVETGIDNCGSVGASVSGTTVKPVPSFIGVGSEETVDHYEVYLSTDGDSLIDVGPAAVGGGSLDVGSLGLPGAEYKVYVQMVGKSHILNRMSAASSVTIVGSGSPALTSSKTRVEPAKATPMSEVPLPSISVLSPGSGASVSSPITLTITTHESFAPARIQVWDRGVKIVDAVNTPSLTKSDIDLSKGQHTLTINVKDSELKTQDSMQWSFAVE